MEQRFRFQLGSASYTGATKPPQEWLPNDAKKRFYDTDADGMGAYLPGHSTLLEVLASRVYYVLNGCLYADQENFIIMFLRPVGLGLRAAFFLSSIIFCFLSFSMSTNPIFQYSFSRERNSEGVLMNDQTDVFEWFVYAVYFVWLISIGSCALSYLLGRGAKQPYAQQCSSFPFLLCNRVSIDGGDGDGSACGSMVLLMIWFLGLSAAASVAVGTAISHTFVTRNVLFSYLLLVFLGMSVMGTLADALSIGGPQGISVQSKAASWIASARVVVIVPVQVIFTVFFLLMCSPPWG